MSVERAEGRADVSYSAMAEIVLEELGVRIKPGTLRGHVATCLPEIHRQILAREHPSR
jgi:C4-type Zn-finger protein